MPVPKTETEKESPCETIKSTQQTEANTADKRQTEEVIECASPPCLLHEIEAGSREFAY